VWTLGKKYDKKGYYIYTNKEDAEITARVRGYQGYHAMVQHDERSGYWLVYVRRDFTSTLRR
jgi:hypothetical protein